MIMKAAVPAVLICAAVCAQEPIDIEFGLEGENLISSQQPGSTGQKLTLGLNKDATGPPTVDAEFDIHSPPPPFGELSRGRVVFVTTDDKGNEDQLLKDRRPFNPLLTWRLRLDFGDITVTGAANDDITVIWKDENGGSLFGAVPYDRIELLDGDTVVDMKTTTRHKFSRETTASREVLIELQTNAMVHPADTDADRRVTTGEKNRFIGTAVAIVQQGLQNDFRYHFDENLGDFQPGPPEAGGLPSRTHAADLDGDGRITTGEKNRFIGTAVAIVQQGLQNDFRYHFDENLGDFQPRR